MKVKSMSWSPDKTLTYWINHASRSLMKTFEQNLRPLGFGMAYMPVVIALDESGELTQKELAQKAGVEQPTMAVLLSRMERDGLIIRLPNPKDGRSHKIGLTDKARECLPAAKKKLYTIAAKASHHLSREEQDRLITVLQHMIKNLESETQNL